jgi:hypothetical protein
VTGPQRSAGRRPWVRWSLVGLLIAAGIAALPALGYAALYLVNPVGDEWVCSHGEAPTRGGTACYPTDTTLPVGEKWDPLGNRPMSYNCDKRGWTLIEGSSSDEQDCLNDNLPVPAGWHPVD